MHPRYAEDMANASGGKMGFQFWFHTVVIAKEHGGDDGILLALEPILGEECGEVVLDLCGGRAEGVDRAMREVMPLIFRCIRGEKNRFSSHILNPFLMI